jgi:ribose 1,5-bisphosphate isomerase
LTAMSEIPVELDRRIALLALDRESGASEILDEVIRVLRDAMARGASVPLIARALCRAQPSMAPVWNAALEAVASARSPQRFERFAHRVARAPDALRRFAIECFPPGMTEHPLRVVTLSFSRSVLLVLDALGQRRALQVSCSEGRPALEGRRLAARLAAAGTPVTCFADAAIGHALASADAVLVGADAVAAEWFLNKSGTRMLAAAAAHQGVPVHLVATRDKFVSRAIAGRIVVTEGLPAEVWDAPPSGVAVRNPYFERTPLDLVASIISDIGVLGAGMVPDVCDESDHLAALQALDAATE